MVQSAEQSGVQRVRLRGVCALCPGPGADEKARLKFPFSACEVLCCEVDEVYSALLRDEGLLAALFGFLDRCDALSAVPPLATAALAFWCVARSSCPLAFCQGPGECPGKCACGRGTPKGPSGG